MPEHSRIILGVITGVHGIQGEVKLKSFTGDPEAIASYDPLDASNGTTLKIKSLKAHKDFFRARLEGIDDRNAAEALKGLELSITRDRLPEPEADEVYHADLIGLCVHDTNGAEIGTVVDVVDFGAVLNAPSYLLGLRKVAQVFNQCIGVGKSISRAVGDRCAISIAKQ